MLADLSDRTKLKMSGADRERYLNGQVTNDVRLLRAGGPALYACVTDARGRLEADVFITALEDAYLIDADASLRESLRARLEKYIIADDVALEDVTESFSLYHLAGDSSEPFDIPGAVLRPSNRYGIEGNDLWTAPGAPAPSPTEKFAAPGQLERLRIAHGVPKWGAELAPGVLPPEAGLEDRAISYTKGCYIGQEVISRIRSAGKVNRRLVVVVASDPAAPLHPGLVLYTENPEKPGPVGALTSCIASPAAGLAWVRTALSAPGTRLYAGTDDAPRSIPLEISKSPLILR